MLASILFFLLVYLGMKYHWGDTIKKLDSTQQIELKLPEMKMPPFNSTTPRIMDDGLGDATVFSKETKKDVTLPDNLIELEQEVIQRIDTQELRTWLPEMSGGIA